MTYGIETQMLITITTKTIAVAQRKMGQIMLDITFRYRKSNSLIRQNAGVKD